MSSRAPRPSTGRPSSTTRPPRCRRSGSTRTSPPRSTAPAAACPTTTSVARARRTAQIRLLDPNKLTPTFNDKQEIAGLLPVQVAARHRPLPARRARPGRRDRGARAQPLRHLAQLVVQQPPDLHPRLRRGGGADRPHGRDAELHQRRPPPGEPDPGERSRRSTSASTRRRTPSSASPPGSTENVEFDHPSTNGGSNGVHNTYQGNGGVPIGSRLTRLLYAVKLRDPNIFFSSGINSGSQLLTVRDPRARVSKVAPWLTLDGDVYPALVDGRVQWVVDGYTSIGDLPLLPADQPPPGDVQLPDQRDGHREPAQQEGQLPAQLGEGRRRRLHRPGHPLRVEPGQPARPRAADLGERVPRPRPAGVEHPVRPAAAPALPAGPLRRAAQPPHPVPRGGPERLLQRRATSGRSRTTRPSPPPRPSTVAVPAVRRPPCPRRTCRSHRPATPRRSGRCRRRW